MDEPVYYHGTCAEFTEFDPSLQGQTAGVGGGFFFTRSERVAREVYAWDVGGRVMAVHLRFWKPLGFEQYFEMRGLDRWEETSDGRDAPVNYFDEHSEEILAFAHANGFDAIDWPADPDSSLPHDLVVVFRTDQIELAESQPDRPRIEREY